MQDRHTKTKIRNARIKLKSTYSVEGVKYHVRKTGKLEADGQLPAALLWRRSYT